MTHHGAGTFAMVLVHMLLWHWYVHYGSGTYLPAILWYIYGPEILHDVTISTHSVYL